MNVKEYLKSLLKFNGNCKGLNQTAKITFSEKVKKSSNKKSLPITNEKGIPVFGSEIEQVKLGCVASSSIEYLDVGYAAGKAAAEILGGKNASDIPVATITEPKSYYNSKACAALGVTVPENTTAIDVAE